jgi:hypothetical protein
MHVRCFDYSADHNIRCLIRCANELSQFDFSTRNIVQAVKPNSLQPEVADKLCYIHINKRAPNCKPHEPKGWFGLSEEELVALEDEILAGHPELPEWLEAVA